MAASNFSGPAQIRYHVETVGGVTYTIVSGNVDIDNSPEFQIGIGRGKCNVDGMAVPSQPPGDGVGQVGLIFDN